MPGQKVARKLKRKRHGLLDLLIIRPSVSGIDPYPSLCCAINQEFLREYRTAFRSSVFFVVVPISAGKEPERPRADGDSPGEIANGNPGYSFTEKNADRLAGRPLRVGHSSAPSVARVGVSRYAARNTLATSGKTESGLCLNCGLHGLAQFDHLGAGLAVECGRDSR